MKVWIDQDLCTGDGLCEEIAPTCSPCSTTASPTSRTTGASSASRVVPQSQAAVPGPLEEAVVEAAEECPGECIFIENA